MDYAVQPSRVVVTLRDIRARVGAAFARSYLCRDLAFEVIAVPRLSKGANWTISMPQVSPDALWEASEIVFDIQEAYMLMEQPALARAA
jgi:hypothetical protein